MEISNHGNSKIWRVVTLIAKCALNNNNYYKILVFEDVIVI